MCNVISQINEEKEISISLKGWITLDCILTQDNFLEV